MEIPSSNVIFDFNCIIYIFLNIEKYKYVIITIFLITIIFINYKITQPHINVYVSVVNLESWCLIKHMDEGDAMLYIIFPQNFINSFFHLLA